MNKEILIILILIGCSLQFIGAETINYVENKDDQESKVLVEIVDINEGVEVTSKNKHVTHYAVINDLFETKRYSYKNTKTDTKLNATRKGNYLIVSGKLKGKAVSTEIEINNKPLYQFMDISLTSLVKGSKKEVTFQFFSPEDLKVWNMVAKKQEIEEVSITGGSVLSQRVKVTLSGFLSMFWSSKYWFDQKTGRFLKYSGENADRDLVVIQLAN